MFVDNNVVMMTPKNLLAGLWILAAAILRAQSTNAPLDLSQYLSKPTNEMRVAAQRYDSDRANLTRFYSAAFDPERTARLKVFDADWLAGLQKLDSRPLSEEARAEQTNLIKTVREDSAKLDDLLKTQGQIAPFVPFAHIIIDLEASRRRVEKMDAEKTAGVVAALARSVAEMQKTVKTSLAGAAGSSKFDASQAASAATTVAALRRVFTNWDGFYNGYDPLFNWWLAAPYKEASKALGDYATFLRSVPAADASASGVAAPVPPQPTLPTIKLSGKGSEVPDLAELISVPQSRMRGVIERFNNTSGRGRRGGGGGFAGGGGFGGGGRGGARGMSRETLQQWLAALPKLDFDKFSHDDQADYVLLRNRIEAQLLTLDVRSNAPAISAPAPVDNSQLFPFEQIIAQLGEAAAGPEKADVAGASNTLALLKTSIGTGRTNAISLLENRAVSNRAGRAASTLGGLRTQLSDWHDRATAAAAWPDSLTAAYQAVDQSLEEYGAFLRENATSGAQLDGSDIVGRPVGRAGLLALLHDEMIPYTPEELITIGEREFAWCESEMKKASRQMGCGDDWHKAVEKVKARHVEAGEQPYLIRDLVWDAVNYMEKNNMISIPMIARETWGMEMMSPQRQLVNPFFTGGAVISVSYPADTMGHEEKLESMRGNNIAFCHATAFHEVIPGHELQGFMSSRYHTERRIFNTPFYVEGWACYWELLMYQRGYDRTPEERIGALFWRMHRCARIVFSLNFHMGKWTPRQCIDYLVDTMGHERDNATAEVRRSFDGSYGPLYQAGYLLGALQLLDLHKELVEKHKMSERSFHDAVVTANSIPIVMVRAIVTNEQLTRDWKPDWRFCGPTPATWKP
jgi:uncharacterized protein (DUF885 family)